MDEAFTSYALTLVDPLFVEGTVRREVHRHAELKDSSLFKTVGEATNIAVMTLANDLADIEAKTNTFWVALFALIQNLERLEKLVLALSAYSETTVPHSD